MERPEVSSTGEIWFFPQRLAAPQHEPLEGFERHHAIFPGTPSGELAELTTRVSKPPKMPKNAPKVHLNMSVLKNMFEYWLLAQLLG